MWLYSSVDGSTLWLPAGTGSSSIKFWSLISSVASSAVLLRASSHLFLSHSSYLVPTRTFGENRKTLRKDYREWNRLNVTDLSVSSLWGKIVANRKSGKETETYSEVLLGSVHPVNIILKPSDIVGMK